MVIDKLKELLVGGMKQKTVEEFAEEMADLTMEHLDRMPNKQRRALLKRNKAKLIAMKRRMDQLNTIIEALEYRVKKEKKSNPPKKR